MSYFTDWQNKGYAFFQNTNCEYFPCHSIEDSEGFNCLFCFCPLYGREDCGGTFYYLDDRLKDCSACAIPHRREVYGQMMERLRHSANKRGD